MYQVVQDHIVHLPMLIGFELDEEDNIEEVGIPMLITLGSM